MFKFVRCTKEKCEDVLIALSEIVAVHSHYDDGESDVVETRKGEKYKVRSETGRIENAIVKI